MDGLKRIAVVLAFAAAAAWAMVAYSLAETSAQPEQTVPQAGDSGSSGSSAPPLSQRLGRSGGVIKPPSGLDPGIAQSPPQDGRTPVIKPPGTAGGKSDVNPK